MTRREYLGFLEALRMLEEMFGPNDDASDDPLRSHSALIGELTGRARCPSPMISGTSGHPSCRYHGPLRRTGTAHRRFRGAGSRR